jgi:glycerol uptake facilitator-like aquaporin
VFKISIFEGVGTLILAYGICCGQYLPPFKDKVINVYYGFFISCSLFLALCWSGSMTGGHINPAVTLGQMFRSPKISLRTGLIYMTSQFIGALFGALLGKISFIKLGRFMMPLRDLIMVILDL